MIIFGYSFTTVELALGGGLILAFMSVSFVAIWDAFRREFPSPTEKFAWIQLAVLFPFVGGLGYFIFGRKRGRKS